MVRAILGAVLALALVAGVALAAETKTEAVVVKFEKESLTVKAGDKEKTVTVETTVPVTDAKGEKVLPMNFSKVLVKDAKVELVEKDGKLVGINVKK